MAHDRSFGADFKRFFGRGLAILLPSIVTLWLLFQAFTFVFANVAEPINRAIRVGVLHATPLLYEEGARPKWYVVTENQVQMRAARNAADGLSEVSNDELRKQIRLQQFRDIWTKNWYLNGLGLVVAIILIYLAGLLLGNYLGRQLYTRVESLIARIPGFKQVYPHVKQVVDLIFGENSTKKAFSEVVLVEYPRKETWSLGFVTGTSFGDVRTAAGGETVSVFIPTSPTPMTGFVINVRRDETTHVDVSIDQALRFIITAGVLTPDDKDIAASQPDAATSTRLLRAERAAQRAAERAADPEPPKT